MYQHKHPKADGERAMAGMTLRGRRRILQQAQTQLPEKRQ